MLIQKNKHKKKRFERSIEKANTLSIFTGFLQLDYISAY